MSAPRAVRIPRVRAEGGRPGVERTTAAPERARVTAAIELRPNVAGSERAVRLAYLYLGAIGLLYLLFVLLEWIVRAGWGTGVEFDLLLFGLAALVFSVGGALFALHPAPRGIEIGPTALRIVGRWGHRIEWSPRNEIRFRLVRRYSAGFLSRAPVESVELSLPGRPPRVYLVGEGFFPIPMSGGA